MRKYLSTTRGNSRQICHRKKLCLVLVIALVGAALFFFVPKVLGKIGSLVFVPIVSSETWILNLQELVPDYFADRHELIGRITELENKLALESVTQESFSRLHKENSELRGILGKDNDERIAAAVIARPTMTPYDVIVLDKGTADGVVESAPVYVGLDQVIGFVAAAYKNSSVVILATATDFESTVYIYGPNIYTTARGVGGGVLEVRVPQGINLNTGDLVMLPVFGTGIFGSVSLVDSLPTEPEQRGYVTLFKPLQSLRLVGVGTKPIEPIEFEEVKEVVAATRNDLLKTEVPDGVLVEIEEDLVATSTATSTATTSEEVGDVE